MEWATSIRSFTHAIRLGDVCNLQFVRSHAMEERVMGLFRLKVSFIAATAAALACAGCSGNASSPDGGFPAGGAPVGGAAPTSGSGCYQWPGLQPLYDIAQPLQVMAGDQLAGADSLQLGGDWLAVDTSLHPLINSLPNLSSVQDAQDVQNEVITPALNAQSESADQLNAAAADAQQLASQISQQCLSSPS
jgi:hypothetical protein